MEKVRVTTDHIKRGVPGDCSRCAIALAFIDSGFAARVDEFNVDLFYEGETEPFIHYSVSIGVRDKVIAIDGGTIDGPFEIAIDHESKKVELA